MKISPVIWSAIQVVGKQGISLLTFFLLSCYLSPKEFGVIGMAMTWILFMMVFSEVGFGAAIIQKKKIDDNHLSTIFVMNLFAGVVLTVLGIFVSPMAAFFYKTPEVAPVLAVLSVGFMVNSFSLTQVALAQREMRFRDLAIRDLISSVIGGFAGLTLAFLGYGVWSLVVQTLVSYTIGSFLIYKISTWTPNLRLFRISYLNELWPYSSKIFYFNLLKFFSQNLDKLLVGYLLGSVSLGLYTFAYKLVVQPVSMVAGSVGNYLFPKFSRHQSDKIFIKEYFVFIHKATNALLVPPLLVLFLSSTVILEAFIDGKWAAASTIVKYLALVGVFQIFYSPVGQLMKSLNRPALLLRWAVFFIVVTMSCLYFGVKNDVDSVGMALFVAHAIGFVWLVFVAKGLIGFDFTSFLAIYKSVFVSSLIMITSYYGLNSIFIQRNNIVNISVSTLLYVLSYVLQEKSFCIYLIKETFSQFKTSKSHNV